MHTNTPNDGPSRTEVLYKLGQIEAKLEANKAGWLEPVRRIEDLLTRLEKQIDRDVVLIKTKVELNEGRINKLEDDLTAWKAKLAGAVAVVSVGWLLFGQQLTRLFNGVI